MLSRMLLTVATLFVAFQARDTYAQTIDKPTGGYYTDAPGNQGKAIKFSAGSLAYYSRYELYIEGVPNTSPEWNVKDKLMFIPVEDYPDWSSDIKLFGIDAAGNGERIFDQPGLSRPSAGYVLDTPQRDRIKFETGEVARFAKYEVVVGAKKYRDITIDGARNELGLPVRLAPRQAVEVFGLNDSDRRIPVFSGLAPAGPVAPISPVQPTKGWVVFHDVATCILFQKGDMTKFAASYELRYEGKTTREYRGLTPTHIRFEKIGHHVTSEMELYAIAKDGTETLLFKGRIRQ
jgi:hypothetical protein